MLKGSFMELKVGAPAAQRWVFPFTKMKFHPLVLRKMAFRLKISSSKQVSPESITVENKISVILCSRLKKSRWSARNQDNSDNRCLNAHNWLFSIRLYDLRAFVQKNKTIQMAQGAKLMFFLMSAQTIENWTGWVVGSYCLLLDW